MGKIITLIVAVLMFLAGIFLVAFGIGIGLFLLVVGLLGTIMMGIIVSSRGVTVDMFTPRGFFDAFTKDKVEKPDKDQPTNIWDQMTQNKKTK